MRTEARQEAGLGMRLDHWVTVCECMFYLHLQRGEKPYKVVKARPKRVSTATSNCLCHILCPELFDLCVSHFVIYYRARVCLKLRAARWRRLAGGRQRNMFPLL